MRHGKLVISMPTPRGLYSSVCMEILEQGPLSLTVRVYHAHACMSFPDAKTTHDERRSINVSLSHSCHPQRSNKHTNNQSKVNKPKASRSRGEYLKSSGQETFRATHAGADFFLWIFFDSGGPSNACSLCCCPRPQPPRFGRMCASNQDGGLPANCHGNFVRQTCHHQLCWSSAIC